MKIIQQRFHPEKWDKVCFHFYFILFHCINPHFSSTVCREWLVREDGVLAYQLQNEESKCPCPYLLTSTNADHSFLPTVNKHYDNNRYKNQVVRTDLHQAKSLQEYEYNEMMRRYQEELDKQLEDDARIAAQIQEQEIKSRDSSKSGLQRQESIVERDRLIAERLQAKEKMKVLKYKLLKEKRQVERVASGNLPSNGSNGGSPGIGDNHSNHSNDSGGARGHSRSHHHHGDIVDVSDLTEFCIKPPEDLTEEEKRIFLEEQDAELARFLQKQEAARNVAKDNTKSTIEVHDAEIARILQEQEKAKARKLREKARLRAIQRQQLQDQRQHESANGHNQNQSQRLVHNNYNSSNSGHVHHQQSSNHNFNPDAAHGGSLVTGSSPTTAAAHSPSWLPPAPVNHSSSNDGSQTQKFNPSHQQQPFDHQGYHHQHHHTPSHGNKNSNPLRHHSGSGGSSSPHFNNNNGTNCCQPSVTTSSHHHPPVAGQNFDTFIQDADDEECFDDDNPIVDNYYPVGDDLKRMKDRKDVQRYPDGYLPAGKVASADSNNTNFHNIAMDLDPTYNRGQPSNGHQRNGVQSTDPTTDINGLHFAQFCRVSPTEAVEANGSKAQNKSPDMNQAIVPVPGHRRQEKTKKNKKMADGCKQQ